MSRIRYRFLVAMAACLVLAAWGTASASVHVSIGFGTTFGHYHPVHRWHAWPHRSWYWYEPWYPYGPVIVSPPMTVTHRRVIVEEHKLPPARPRVETGERLSEAAQQKRGELLKRLRIGDVSVRTRAVADLGPFANDSQTRTALERALLSDRETQVRKAVAELLARVKDAKTLPALKQAYAEDSDREVRQAAYRAIIMIEGYPL